MTTSLRVALSLATLLALAACGGDPGASIGPASNGDAPPTRGGAASHGDDAGAIAQGGGGDDAAAPGEGTGDAGAGGDDAGGSDGATGHDPEGGAGAPAIEYAPYFPTWTWGSSGYPYTSLVDLQQKAGVNGVTIAFVLSGGGCKADDGIAQNLADVNAFRQAGGRVKASFGGASGTYVESQCKDAASLAKAIGDFVDATGITDLDFDIEQDPVMTDAANKLRGEGLKLAQDAKHVRVAFTLAANPSPNGGLTDQGKSVVSHAVAAGVAIAHVNLMTMDYGDSFGGKSLAPVAIGSLTDANAQLVTLIPGLTTQTAWRVLGVIPMIGKNDDAEVFSIADAKAVAKFATDHQLGLVAFWSIDRDQTCKGGADFNTCSTVDPADFAFSDVFVQVTR